MNWLYYLAEANLYLCVFYLAYCVFLVKETHYQLNRAYLLLSCVMAFVLPVLQVGALKPGLTDNTPVVSYPATQTIQYMEPSSIISTPVATVAPVFNINDYLWLAYVAGAVIVLLLLTLKLYSVFKLTRNTKAKLGSYKMIYLKDTDVAFSFFNYLFIGTRAAGANTIITHELVHIRQKHSADIMFLELLKVICWFNPCIYLLQNSLKTVHEYIADEQTAATEADALTYSSFLVNNAYGAGGSSITHSFFNYNLLKKRIIMLNQQRSGKLARLKYLVALPICAGLLCASTLAFSKSYAWVDLTPTTKTALLPDTLTTSKGFKYKETIYTESGHKRCSVTLFESGKAPVTFKSDPLPARDFHLLKEKYGYSFPEGTMSYAIVKMSDVKWVSPPPGSKKAKKVPTIEIRAKKTDVVKFPPRYAVGKKKELSKLSPPPPEPPKPKADQVKFPPKTKIDVVKFPPPEPPKPKVDQVKFPPKQDVVKFPPLANGELRSTSKGYKYEETGYLIDGKETNFRVIIHEKNGEEKDFFRNSATKEQIELLKDKYGYTFPSMQIHDKMPPPPPMAPAARPAKPTSSLLNKNSNEGGATNESLNND
nr:M56 family metallopeptidase [uncultured Mucilaginibacter sp.]